MNVKYCKTNNIIITRRLSGGGAVYHDFGNVNMSFFLKKDMLPQIKTDIKSINAFFTELIISSLQDIISGYFKKESYSNILYNGKKISGSAGYRKGEWIFHHATLLMSSNLEHLEKSLLVKSRNPVNKSMSKYFPTTNLPKFSFPRWERNLKLKVEEKFNLKLKDRDLKKEEKELAKELAEKVYKTEEWIYNKKRKLKSQ